MIFGLMLGISVASVAEAIDFSFQEYTYSSSSCATIKDPMNLYYTGNPMGYVNAFHGSLWATQTILGYTNSGIAGDQWMFNSDPAVIPHCQVQIYNRAQYIIAPRYHTRLFQGYDAFVGAVVASPQHHDVLSICGDVADTFNGARDFAVNKYDTWGGFVLAKVFTGNNLAIQQCDGRMTASDGNYWRISRP